MDYNFFLIDDDISVVSILSHIIVTQNLGDVIGKNITGEGVLEDIKSLRPDIVLIDLLLPKNDGISLVRLIKAQYPHMPIVMISEVQAKEMVAKAYDEGVEFFVHKPINVKEVVTLIGRIDEKLKLLQVVDRFQSAFMSMQSFNASKNQNQSGLNTTIKYAQSAKKSASLEKGKDILSELGIFGEGGARDLIFLLDCVDKAPDRQKWLIGDWTLTELFQTLSQCYSLEKTDAPLPRSIEQRIRRCVAQAQNHIAGIATEDFEHELVYVYGNKYFDFLEIRREMALIKGKGPEGGRVNIKKFVVAFLCDVLE